VEVVEQVRSGLDEDHGEVAGAGPETVLDDEGGGGRFVGGGVGVGEPHHLLACDAEVRRAVGDDAVVGASPFDVGDAARDAGNVEVGVRRQRVWESGGDGAGRCGGVRAGRVAGRVGPVETGDRCAG